MLWNNKEKAQALLKQKSALATITNNFFSLERDFSSFKEYLDLVKNEDISESEKKEMDRAIEALHNKAQKLEIECLFSGEADNGDCFLEINAGAGGTESHDWAEMLLRMYLRYAEKKFWLAKIL